MTTAEQVPEITRIIEGLPHTEGYSGHWRMDLYTARQIVGEMVKPRSVFEFGAYMGWAMIAVGHGSGQVERFGWIDNEHDVPGSNRLARANLKHVFPSALCRWETESDHAYAMCPRRDYDVVLVDSGHDMEHTSRDLIYALTLHPKTIVIDDTDAIPIVREATLQFGHWIRRNVHLVSTHNGMGVIELEPYGIPQALADAGWTVATIDTRTLTP